MMARMTCFFFLLLPLGLLAQPKGDLQQQYLRFLRARGYDPYIDRDGDVQFQAEGLTLYLRVDAQRPTFFRLVLPNFWPIETAAELAQARRACDDTNRQVEGVKLYVQRQNVWLAVEQFMGQPDDFEAWFEPCLAAALLGVKTFRLEMRR